MKIIKKMFLMFVILIIAFSVIQSLVPEAIATDSTVVQILKNMEKAKIGAVNENFITKGLRTAFAISQILFVGYAIITMTWAGLHFFSTDPAKKAAAKDALPYRIGALAVFLAIDGIVIIIAAYLTPDP